MKKFLVLFLLISSFGFAQNLNDYKYAMVPAKFSFLKDDNMYNLNLFTKMYLQKYGFESYYDNEVFPTDFASNNCNKIFIDVLNNSNMFTTKLKVVLKDCKNNILATSDEGTSREKEYKVAYNEALRMAFDNFGVLKMHKFQPSQTVVSIAKSDAIGNEFNPKNEVATNQIFFKKYNVVATETGFNLITVASDYKIFKIFKTSSNDVFIANRDSISGILIKKNDSWFFEYYDGNVLKSELIKVTF